jgi:hypothetical protein
MRNTRLLVAVFGSVAAVALVLLVLRGGPDASQEQWSTVQTYCLDCHNSLERAGELSFDALMASSVPEHPEIFEAVINKLRGRLMPPPGGPQPDQTEVDALIAWLERSIDASVETHTVGYVPAHRLNRTEYTHAVKGLLGVEIDAAELLPADIEVDGFTNIAAALSASPAFVEQYVDAANVVARLAVGEPRPRVATATYARSAGNQEAYVAGMPLGTRGGIRFTHPFPADGEYRLTLTNLGVGLYPSALETEHTLVVLVDRDEVFRANIGGPADLALADRGGAPGRAEIMDRFTDIPMRVEAGPREIIVTFIERSRASDDEQITRFSPTRTFSYSGAPRVPGIVGSVNLTGPFDSTGLTRTESRRKLFICEPEVPEVERACAERIAVDLARRAFRRPVDQADLDRLMPFYEEGRAGPGGFDEGIELLTVAVLASPDFLYRTIAPPRQPREQPGRHLIDDFELASRLSFFLWSQGPDEALLELAAEGTLSDPQVLDAQVQRMLADARAEVLVTDFARHWLHVADLEAVEPDSAIFPEFSEALRRDFDEEMTLFLSSVLLQDRNIRTLLTADHTFLNERLARHYGVPGVVGPQFRRVQLADDRRHGLLGKGAVLLRTSYGDRTSPVLRGAWVLETLMGTPPAPPPPEVETDLNPVPGEEPTTLRARLEQHRADPSCNACHGVIDPYGLPLEHFSAIGSWRDDDESASAPIDSGAELPDGTVVASPADLRAALLRRPDQLVQALTKKLMMYALGRELEHYDMPQVRAIVRAAEADGFRFSALVAGVVRSDAFRMQAVTGEEVIVTAQAAPADAGRSSPPATGRVD